MFLLCFKRYLLNFAIAHVHKRLFCLSEFGHTFVALKHNKTGLSLETSSEINCELIKFVNCLPLTKTNREYSMFGNDFPHFFFFAKSVRYISTWFLPFLD